MKRSVRALAGASLRRVKGAVKRLPYLRRVVRQRDQLRDALARVQACLEQERLLRRTPPPAPPAVGHEPGTLTFRCNLCCQPCTCRIDKLDLESPSCPHCTGSLRYRGIVHALSLGLFGRSLPLPEFPHRPDLVGIGMSDCHQYAVGLSERLGYTNTYYHKEPVYDVCTMDRVPQGPLDFVISTEVLEHVPPPAQKAFDNMHALLKPGGLLVFSVPYYQGAETIEHFPELHDYRLEQRAGRWVLCNTTADGRYQEFNDLVFHGGPGETLEMRVFASDAVRRHLADAGFHDIQVHDWPCLEYGVCWPVPWAYVLSARA